MNTSNNVNIDLRPGTRLIRETRGGREVMWVEDNTIWGTSSGSGSWFWAMLIVLAIFLASTAATDNPEPDREIVTNAVQK